jgi:pimeloyl-ACP methyl ester carboxylesterase
LTDAVVTTITTRAGEARLFRRKGTGPALVLIHCCGGNEHTFDLVLPHLGAIDVVVPALPGRPGSTGEAFESAGEAARWVLEVAKAANVGEFVIGGYSYGGAVAIECALAAEETGAKIVGLALVSSGARLRVLPSILTMADEAVAQDKPLLFGDALYQPGTPVERIAAAEAAFATTPPAAARADWRACDAFDRLKDIGRIRVPTLVVSGTMDLLTPPKYAAFVATNLTNARVVTIEGGGHALPVEKPDEVGAALTAFAGELGEQTRASRS